MFLVVDLGSTQMIKLASAQQHQVHIERAVPSPTRSSSGFLEYFLPYLACNKLQNIQKCSFHCRSETLICRSKRLRLMLLVWSLLQNDPRGERIVLAISA